MPGVEKEKPAKETEKKTASEEGRKPGISSSLQRICYMTPVIFFKLLKTRDTSGTAIFKGELQRADREGDL